MPVTLEEIPVLRFSYDFKRIAPLASGAKARYPVNASLLDRVSLYQGDITKLEVDAILNAANESLLGGGGVDGQIHRAAGPDLLKECSTLDGCKTGHTKITKGYKLPAKHVLHTVGPVYSSSQKDKKAEQLRSCYRTCLELTVKESLTSVAFCSVSTGIYGYPIYDATHIALDETRVFLESEAGEHIERIIFCVWSDKDKDIYEELVPLYFPDEAKDGDEAKDSSAEDHPESEAKPEEPSSNL